MTGYTQSPKVLKGGLVLLDPGTAAIQRIISLQYNPESLTRTLQMQAVGGEGPRAEPLRLKGPAVESLRLEAEIDAADQLELPEQHQTVVKYGVQPQLAALEALVHPASERLLANLALANAGTLEIAPIEAPLTLFVWSRSRIVPVRVTEFSITEEAFDPSLNPIRAKVSLGLRVLSIDDLGFDHKGGQLFMGYLQTKERLATQSPGITLGALGLGGIP
ncbi:MAG: hypothetical protein ACFCUJ_10065 [Thiotrichales bacterium]